MQHSKQTYIHLRDQIFNALDASVLESLSKSDLERQLSNAVDMLVSRDQLSVSSLARSEYVVSMIHELVGLGPLQVLMDDDTITDIMINGHQQVYVERFGLVQQADVHFLDEKQLADIAKRIASRVGRRVDESSPTCDARLEDGSRVNIVLPPIAIDGTAISIRKFRQESIGFADLVEFGALSPEMAKLLQLAARCRLNILVAGGTGSGKTTLLNALSQYISQGERVVTIEDTAELRLLQPHVFVWKLEQQV